MGQMPKTMRMFGPAVPSLSDGLEPGDAWVDADGVLRFCGTAGPPAVWIVSNLKWQDRMFAMTPDAMDLSGAATVDSIMLHATKACTLRKLTAVYPEALSNNTGIVVTVGKEGDDNYYYTGTCPVNKAAWYEEELTLLKTDLAAGDTLVCGQVGSKTGTGTLIFVAEYTVDD